MNKEELRKELDYDINDVDFYWEENTCREIIGNLEDKVIDLTSSNKICMNEITGNRSKIKELEEQLKELQEVD